MKVACNNIFVNIFIAKVITDFWGTFLLVWLTKLMVLNLRKRFNVENALTFYILDTCFCTTILDSTVFGLRSLDTIVIYIFRLFLYYTCNHSVRIIWRLFNQLTMQINWLVSVWFASFNRSVYFFPCSIYSINLIICFMLSWLFGLLVLLTFFVVRVVVDFSFLKFIPL